MPPKKRQKTTSSSSSSSDSTTAGTDVPSPSPTRAPPRPPHVGFGKLILFGEHFTVYRKPALVAALEDYTYAEVELKDKTWSCGLVVEDDRMAVPGYKDEKREEMLASVDIILKHFHIDTAKRGVCIKMGGPLCAVSGVGASAASCVAIARALSALLNREMNEEQINAAAFEGEKGYHGTPSGIDNTAATYGGLLKFQRNEGGPPSFETCKLPSPCLIVYASTGITSSTTEVVGDVRKRREADPAWYAALEKRYDAIFPAAHEALLKGDWPTVGRLCDENHAILQELTVSCKELDDLVTAARNAGALGAKMAGTGRGGLMFAICEDEAAQAKVFEALEKITGKGQCWKTTFT